MFPKLPLHMVHNMSVIAICWHHLVQLVSVFLQNSRRFNASPKEADKVVNKGFIFHALNHVS